MMRRRDMLSADIEQLGLLFKQRTARNAVFAVVIALLLFAAFAVNGVKLFYPHHFAAGMLLFAAAALLGLFRLYAAYRNFQTFHTYDFAKMYYRQWRSRALVTVLLLGGFIVFLRAFPLTGNPFRGMSAAAITRLVEKDQQYAVFLVDRMAVSGTLLIESANNEPFDREAVLDEWRHFLQALLEGERLMKTHSCFNYIHPVKQKQAHKASFMLACALYSKKNEYAHRIISLASADERLRKLLNETIDAPPGRNYYSALAAGFYSAETLIKINAWRAYAALLDMGGHREAGPGFMVLRNEAENAWRYLTDNSGDTLLHGGRVAQHSIESRMFEAWFPVQKGIANLMGDTFLSTRTDRKLITVEQIRAMQAAMQPGDIMVQRRNWYLSNAGIPGFWTHVALYTGDMQTMNQFFAELFPYKGAASFEAYLQREFPALHDGYLAQDQLGHSMAAYEARAPGVVLYSLEESAYADSVGVLRPRLNRMDLMLALFRAFENYRKPYDYNFDFDTRDELVCSEVVYDAYLPVNKSGLKLETTVINGRSMYAPTDFVKKFYDERETPLRELDFVWFLDGHEQLKQAFVKGETEFMTTWTRRKFDLTL